MDNILKTLNARITVIDVRTLAEYADGHLPGSINIPLNEIPNRLGELKKQPERLVVCCASGIRSNKAANILKQHGIECADGGSWLNLKHLTDLNK
jgi:rhodanese-related sulfurtransferase